MASGLAETGVRFVSQGEAAFVKNINLGAKALGALEAAATIAAGPLAVIGSALGNVAQIALGILGRDLIKGLFKGVKSIVDDATKAIFGSADAIKELRDNASKAAADLPELRTQLGLARLKLAEMNKDSKASAVDLAEQAVAVRKLEAELSTANSTIREAEVANHKYGESLAGMGEALRGKLVGVAKTLIEKYLPTLTSGFQKLSPILLNLATRLGDFLANPAFLAAAQRLIDWFTTTLPVAINNVSKAIQPVLDILFGAGSWQEKLQAIGQLIVDWFTDMIPQITGKLGLWGRTFIDWITEQGTVISNKITNEWGPKFVNWITDPATLQRAGAALGTFAAWLLDAGMKLFTNVAASVAKIFLSVFNVGVNAAGANSPATIVGTFLKSFWDAFSKSQVFKEIEKEIWHTWLRVRGATLTFTKRLYEDLVGAWADIKVATMNAWFTISEFVRDIFLDIRDHGIDKFNKLKDALALIWNTIATIAKKIWGDVHFAVLSSYYDLENKLKLAWSLFAGDAKRAWEKITKPITDTWTKVHDFLTDPQKRQEMFDGAVNWIKGFIDGLKQKAYDIYNTVRDIFNKVIQTIKSILGIASPSKLGIALGANFGAAFGLGMKDALQGVALEAFAQVSPPSMNGGGASSYSYSNSTSYAPSLTINSPAPANVGQSFALLGAMVGGPLG